MDAILEHPQNPQRSHTGRTVKLSAKAQETKIQAKHTTNTFNQRSPPALLKRPEVEILIVQLTKILGNWDEGANVLATQVEKEQIHEDPLLLHAGDPSVLLAKKVHSANAGYFDQFVCSTQFDVEEPETYAKAMQGPNSTECAKAMKEELDQLHKNDTWTLMPKDEIEPGHRPLGGKWVYKIERDVDGNVARFKAR